MQIDPFGYNLHPRRRHWLEAGGLLVWPHWQCLPVQDNVVQPTALYDGRNLQDSLQSRHTRRLSALIHLTFLSHDLASPSSSAPGAWTSVLPGNKELFSPPLLSFFCKTYMLQMLPSLQMSVTLQHNPSLLFPGETCYPYVKYRGLSYRDVWVAFRNCANKMFLNQIFSSDRKRRSNTTLPSMHKTIVDLPLRQKVSSVTPGKKLPLGKTDIPIDGSFWEEPCPGRKSPNFSALSRLSNPISRSVSWQYLPQLFHRHTDCFARSLQSTNLLCYVSNVSSVRKELVVCSLNVKNINKL